MEMIADTGRLGSLDIMELNPALDVRNRTAEIAVELVASLFGKSTLMRRETPPGYRGTATLLAPKAGKPVDRRAGLSRIGLAPGDEQ
jgi:hypothetical protein